MSVSLEFLKEELEMYQYTVTELEKMGHETFNELQELDRDYTDIPDYLNLRDRLLNKMGDYRTAIRINKLNIKKIEVSIANSTK